MLRCCYPVAPPVLAELDDIRLLLETARRYDMQAPIDAIVRALRGALADDPLGVFCVAALYGIQGMAAEAARATLNYRFEDMESPQLQRISVEMYRKLMLYHARCGDAAYEATRLDNGEWLKEYPSYLVQDRYLVDRGSPTRRFCHDGVFVRDTDTQTYMVFAFRDDMGAWMAPIYVSSYLDRAGVELRIRPSKKTLDRAMLMIDIKPCAVCGQDGTVFDESLTHRLEAEVER